MKRIAIIVITVLITALVVGFGFLMWHRSVINKISERRQNFDKKYVDMFWSSRSKDSEIKNLRLKIDRLEEALRGPVDKLPRNLLRVYCYNAMIDIEGVDFCVAAPMHTSLDKRMDLIADVLMKYHFKKGLIKVKKIEQRGDKKIAVVELLETKECPYAWKGQYFQGSSGGHVTTYALSNTFLQPEYTGEWIDGVEFWYEGEPISDDWDHIFLSGTKYRKPLKK